MILSELELIKIIENVINEGSHSLKDLNKLLSWAEKNLNIRVETVKSGFKVCPPLELTDQCYTVHAGPKGIFDLMRFLSKTFNIPKRDIELAFKSNRPLSITT